MLLYRTVIDRKRIFSTSYKSCLRGGWQERKYFLKMNLHETPSRRLILLAPSSARLPAMFNRPRVDRNRYWNLLHELQRLRGEVYLQDGAIEETSLVDGRHHSDLDCSSWHLLVTDAHDRIRGCARFHEHARTAPVSELTAARCALARIPEWTDTFFSALRTEVAFSDYLDIPFVELGGWALGEEIRGTSEALRIALATYAFWQMFGGAISISTATRRHCASSILRRIGGRTLSHDGVELPAYYDPQYDCQMELLKFYAWAPNPRYAPWIDQMKEELSQIAIIARHSEPDERRTDQFQDWRTLATAKTA